MRRIVTTLTAAAVLVTGLGSLTTGAAAPLAAGSTVGAPGAGDPYFPTYGNGGYNVRHYAIGVTYRVGPQTLRGDTTLRAVATQRLTRFDLDLQLPTDAVYVDGKAATFSRSGRELVITPARAVADGAPFTVRVVYGGVPGRVDTGGLGKWFETSDGAVVAGEPEAATTWYPSNDHPRDKATFDIRVTTDTGTQVISNGRLVGTSAVGTDLRQWHWQMARPITTYLAYAAIGDFTIRRGTSPGGIPWLYGVSDHLGTARRSALRSLQVTPKVVDFYTREFGRYPFDSAGGTLANVTFPFSLETASRPVYSKVFFDYGRNTGVIAHELAHMWFGDEVSVRRWRDIWLNEGFATWSSWLWAAHTGGMTLNQQFRYTWGYDGIWNVKIGDPGRNRVFDGAVYNRGAMALQAVRNRIGEAHFHRLLRTWVRAHAYGNGRIGQFRRLAEQISGQDLGGLFHAWLYTTHRPARTKANGFPPSML